MIRTATLTHCGTYRYSLARTWGDPDSENILCVIMLNPSTADASIDDPTIRRCIGFAKREGCDGLKVLNAYALRATDPRVLRRHLDPVGKLNDVYLMNSANRFGNITVAWGTNIDPSRQKAVRDILRKAGCFVSCFGTTKAGFPKHPLYLKNDAPLVAWEGMGA